jgi:polyferredoxin
VPALGAFLRWRHARTTLQSVTLVLAALVLLDGFFGPALAPRNLAGVVPWVHWRGFVVLGLLAVGNLFCMACPFMLPRRLAKRWLPARLHWPAFLRSKWLAVGLLVLFFWAYEAFSLWSSPWLTAWVGLAYFAGAFVIDGFFRGAAFCRWVCPIGQFHFVNAMVSPFEVRVRDAEVCAACTTKDCIRGRYPAGGSVAASAAPAPEDPDAWAGRPLRPDAGSGRLALAGAGSVAASGRAEGRQGLIQGGCELALYLPRKVGNLDCTFCMECIQACPHDNVGIVARSPLREFGAPGCARGWGGSRPGRTWRRWPWSWSGAPS